MSNVSFDSAGDPVHVDGSFGEGGGQILRSSLSLAMIQNRPVRVTNIRAQRPNPGLAPQHLTAVKAAAAVTDARVQGDELGSTDLTFEPLHYPQSGHYRLNVEEQAPNGSAGAVSLIFQTVLAPLSLATDQSKISITGGTHVAWSPPVHYLRDVYLDSLNPTGFRSSVELERWGFYPRGGGRITAAVQGHGPDWHPGALTCTRRGRLEELTAFSAVSNLSSDILQRQTRALSDGLRDRGFECNVEPLTPDSPGPGTVSYIRARYENVSSAFVAYGRRGKPAEKVGEEAVEQFVQYHHSGAPVDRYLADQLIIPLSMVREPSVYRTTDISNHLLTNSHVVETLTSARVEIEEDQTGTGTVRIRPG